MQLTDALREGLISGRNARLPKSQCAFFACGPLGNIKRAIKGPKGQDWDPVPTGLTVAGLLREDWELVGQAGLTLGSLFGLDTSLTKGPTLGTIFGFDEGKVARVTILDLVRSWS